MTEQLEEQTKTKITRETRALELVGTAGTQIAAIKETIEGILVEDQESCGQVGDLIKDARRISRKFDDERKALVGPLNDTVKRINGHFKPIINQCSDVDIFGKKALKNFAIEQARIADELRKKEMAEQKEREDAALAAAANLEHHDNEEAAEEIIESTIKAGAQASKVQRIIPSRGSKSTVSVVRRWSAEVDDIKALCLGIAEGRLEASLITVNLRELNQLAQVVEKDVVMDGIHIFQDIGTSVR